MNRDDVADQAAPFGWLWRYAIGRSEMLRPATREELIESVESTARTSTGHGIFVGQDGVEYFVIDGSEPC